MMKGPKLRLKVYDENGRRVFDQEVDYSGVRSSAQVIETAESLLVIARRLENGKESHGPGHVQADLGAQQH